MSHSLLSRRRAAVAALTLGSLPFQACNSLEPKVWVEDQQVLSLSGEGVARFACSTGTGAISTRGAEISTYEVVVARRAGGQTEADAQACLAAIEVTHDKQGDELRLGWRWTRSRQSGWGAAISFDIQQPASTPLVATTHNGAIAATGLLSGIDLTTHNGPIDIGGCRGPTRASSHNGPIRGQVESRQIAVETHNGAVDLQLLGGGPIAGSIQTHNGGVALRVATGVSTRLVCTTGNGGVRVERECDTIVRNHKELVANLGGGGEDLDVGTHNGAIVVR